MSDIRLEDVKRLRLEQGDVLVITLPAPVTMEHRQQVIDHLAEWNIRALLLDPDADLQVVSSAVSLEDDSAGRPGPGGARGTTSRSDG